MQALTALVGCTQERQNNAALTENEEVLARRYVGKDADITHDPVHRYSAAAAGTPADSDDEQRALLRPTPSPRRALRLWLRQQRRPWPGLPDELLALRAAALVAERMLWRRHPRPPPQRSFLTQPDPLRVGLISL